MEALCLPASAVQRWCKQKHFNMRGLFEFYHVTKKSLYTASLNTLLFSRGLQCLECASLSLS